MGPMNHALDGDEIPHGKAQLLGVIWPIQKYRLSLLWCLAVCSRRDHSVPNNGSAKGIIPWSVEFVHSIVIAGRGPA